MCGSFLARPRSTCGTIKTARRMSNKAKGGNRGTTDALPFCACAAPSVAGHAGSAFARRGPVRNFWMTATSSRSQLRACNLQHPAGEPAGTCRSTWGRLALRTPAVRSRHAGVAVSGPRNVPAGVPATQQARIGAPSGPLSAATRSHGRRAYSRRG